jgi:hypothetical protein
MRLTCPDMELWIRSYCEDDVDFFEKYRSIFAAGIHPLVETRGEIFMSQVHNWGHRWNYDFDSLRHVLRLAGFDGIAKRTLHDGDFPDLSSLEPDSEGRKLETLYLEARKA